MISRQVVLEGGPPWGFRMHGGADVGVPLQISRVNSGSKAASRGIRESDLITSINGKSTKDLKNVEAHNLLRNSGNTLKLGLNENGQDSLSKRHYKTVHQETTQETIKRSSLKTYTLQETKDTTKNSSSKAEKFNEQEASEYSKEFREYSETHNQKNGKLGKLPITPDSTSSSTSTPTTLRLEGNRQSSSDYAIASRQSSYSSCSSFTDEGKNQESYTQTDTEETSMNNEGSGMSKSKKRRLRRKNLSKSANNVSRVEIEEIVDQETQKTEEIEIGNTQSQDSSKNPELNIEFQTNLNTRKNNSGIQNTQKNSIKLFKDEYKVESPKEIKFENINLIDKRLKAKSKSLDDEDFFKISEVSDNSESEGKIGNNENKGIISEASSEENLLDNVSESESKLDSISLTLTDNTGSITKSLISPEEEKELRNFLGGLNLINSPEQSAKEVYETDKSQNEAKSRKIQKRKELEQYFLPICENPRFLDAISEEASDISDKECSNDAQHLKQGTPDLDSPSKNVDDSSKTQKVPEVPTRKSRSRILEKMCNQVEQEPAKLVETKVLEEMDTQDTVRVTQMIVPEEASKAEVVFINDSSESTSNTSSGDFSDICVIPDDKKEEDSDTITDQKQSSDERDEITIDIIDKNSIRPIESKYMPRSSSTSLNKEYLTTKISSEVTSSVKFFKTKDNFESKSTFDSTQLTPPPTPENSSPKNEENHDGNVPKVILFDYTRIPNVLTLKENVSPHLQSVFANQVTIENKMSDHAKGKVNFSETKKVMDIGIAESKSEAGSSQLHSVLADQVTKENKTRETTQEKVIFVKTAPSINKNNKQLVGETTKTIAEDTKERKCTVETEKIYKNLSKDTNMENLCKIIKSDVFQDQKYERYVPVVNEVQSALREREEIKRLRTMNRKLQETQALTNQTNADEKNVNKHDTQGLREKITEENKQTSKNKINEDEDFIKEHTIKIEKESELLVPVGNRATSHDPTRNCTVQNEIHCSKEHFIPIEINSKTLNYLKEEHNKASTIQIQKVSERNLPIEIKFEDHISNDRKPSSTKTGTEEHIIPIQVDTNYHQDIISKTKLSHEIEEHVIPITKPHNNENKKASDIQKINDHIIPIKVATEPSNNSNCKNPSSKKSGTKEHVIPIQIDKNTVEDTKSKMDQRIVEHIIPIALESKNASILLENRKSKSDDIRNENTTTSQTRFGLDINERIIPITVESESTTCPPENRNPKSYTTDIHGFSGNIIENQTNAPEKAISPTPSDSSSSSETTSISTAKYIPTASFEDVTSISKEEVNSSKEIFEPQSLRNLVLKRLLDLPFGAEILKELAEVSRTIDDYTSKMPFKGLSGHIPAFMHKDEPNISNFSDRIPVKMPQIVAYTKESRQNKIEEEHKKLYQLHQSFHLRKNDDTNESCNSREMEGTSPNRLLSIIREEPSAEKDYLYFADNSQERLKAQNLNQWLTLARDKSKSTSNLSNADYSINSSTRCESASNSNSVRRRSLPQELCEKQLRAIMEKEMEIQRELEWLEEEKRKIQAELAPSNQKFKADEFKVSKRGDFAERKEKSRPTSMPVIPTEFFRQQMYEEYLDKFSERQERKQQKVLKISSSNDLSEIEKQSKPREVIHPIEIEQEFMSKVKEKMKKQDGVHTNKESNEANYKFKEAKQEDGTPILILDGTDVKPADSLPKHLQDILDDLTATSEDDSIWSPGQRTQQQGQSSLKNYQRSDSRESQNNEPTTPVWTPKSASSSPTVERKEFRSVSFQSPVLNRRNRTCSETIQTPDSTCSDPPRKLNEDHSRSDIHLPSRDPQWSSSLDRRIPTSQSTPGFGSFNPSPRLPRVQNPTITLLQKAREGQLPRGAHYIEPVRPDPLERKVVPKPRVPVKLSGDHHIKSDYESDCERPNRMNDSRPTRLEAVGPVTNDGMPLILRSEIKEKDQSKWYKKMYDTIHKQKPARAQYPYSSGYLSEPEPGSYDSDFSEYKYQSLDRRRGPQAQYYYDTSTMPRNNYVPDKSYSSSDNIKNTLEKYDNKPGRIENYTPGKSSISDKEAKRWWDEVMDIFDGHLEQQKRVPTFSQPNNPRSFINQALKESGYESDSTLVFRRKEDTANLISPKEQKQAYKTIQQGGDVPFQGLRKLVPEKPKETDLIEFFKLSPTLTKIRIHKNITPQNEFFVYPATIHHFSPPTFASLKRTAPSSVTIPKSRTPPPEPAPSPPRRRSSRNNSTLRLISTMKVLTDKSTSFKRHETCFSPGPSVDKTKVNYLRDKISYKLSPQSKRKNESPKISVTKKITASPELKSKITSTITTSRDPKSSTRRVQSSTKISARPKSLEPTCKLYKSGSISTLSKKSSTESLSSRTSTPVKTFGSEKRKFDLTLPKSSDSKIKLAKTRSEELLSPTEVQKVIQNPRYRKTVVSLSKNEVLPIRVGMSSKAKDILKPSSNRPVSVSPKTTRRVAASPVLSKKTSVESLNHKKAATKTAITSKMETKHDEKNALKSKEEVAKKAVKKPVDNVKCFSKASGLNIAKKIDQTDISKQKELMETNHFFRHLFLRNINPSSTFSYPKSSLVLEKTNMLTRRRKSLCEPTVGAMKIYLKHIKPVTDSKFVSLDLIRSRSTSPKSVTFSDSVGDIRCIGKRSTSLPAKIVFSQTTRPVSPVVTKKLIPPILKTSYKNRERSASPPAKLVFSQTSRPVSPIVSKKLQTSMQKDNLTTHLRSPSPQTKLFFSETSRPISPEVRRRIPLSLPQSPVLGRSPSSRKIMQFRQQNHAQELSIYTCPNLNHSTTSLDSFRSEDFCKELSFSKPSEKFKDLNHFYTDIAKVSELEKTFDLKPRKKCENEIIDFDRWQEVRQRERAEYELKHLYSHLKENEKEKGFLFRPKDIEKFRWKIEYDRGLRNKDKSVENIKYEFERLQQEESERENAKRRELAYSKDTYKPLWRGNSVLSLASILTEKRSRSEGRVQNSKQKLIMDDEQLLTRGIGSRIWSSLSMEQVNNLKKQLQEIYGEDSPFKKSREPDVEAKCVPKYSVDVPKSRAVKNIPKLTVRRNSESAKPDPMTEDEKKMISYTLSKEVLENIAKRRKDDKLALPLVVGRESLGAIAARDANIKLTNKKEPVKPLLKTDALKMPSASETESASTDDSAKTVINAQDVQKKVEYFEKARDTDLYIPTIHKPAEEDSEDRDSPKSGSIVHSRSSQDLKEFFGESDLVKFATLPLSASRKTEIAYKKKPELRATDMSPILTISESNSFDSLLRSRSVSPYSEEAQNLAKKGEVERLKRQFEIFEDIFGEKGLKRSKSENDLGNLGQVEDLRRKYEYPVYSGRGRSRTRKAGVVSPVYLRAEDRYMPHINIISKIAALYSSSKKSMKKGSLKNMQELADILGCPLGEVEKMKEKFDKIKEKEEKDEKDNVSLLGRMYTSSPSLKELRDITPYLTANWIAHKFPKTEDNTRSLSSPETSVASWDTSLVRRDKIRAKSSSPTKKGVEKQKICGKKKNEISKKRESSRYTKDPPVLQDLSQATNLGVPVQTQTPVAPPPPPPPPPKSHQEGVLRSLSQESPRRYVENQVNIHYKTPVRQEIKEYVSEDELAHRQAETMKKIYEEERKRKYLQELQDMKSRRHTDNFIPSQKSPISLNRYDDFEDLTSATKTRPKSPEPRLVARALYNFVGHTSRELTFRKGDLIYVRKQIDKNWYEGELNAMVGLFPTNYVEIVPYEGVRTTPRKAHEGQARAKYNFVAQTHLELSLAKGELVTITRRVDDNWFEGKIGGRKGIFPVAYVEVLIDPSEPPPPTGKPLASPAAHSLLLNGSSQGKESMGSHHYTPIGTTPQPPSYHAKPIQLTGNGTYSTLPKSSNKSPINQELRIDTQSDPVAYRALYKYTPQNDDELELLENDIVFVLEKCDDGWFVGSSDRTGAFGTFPGNYVEKVNS